MNSPTPEELEGLGIEIESEVRARLEPGDVMAYVLDREFWRATQKQLDQKGYVIIRKPV